MPGDKQLWVRTLDDATGPNIHVIENGRHYRSVEWEPGMPRKGLWDMGHEPGAEYRLLRDQYMNGKISTKDFLDEYRDPANYRAQDPARNHSHVDEGP